MDIAGTGGIPGGRGASRDPDGPVSRSPDEGALLAETEDDEGRGRHDAFEGREDPVRVLLSGETFSFALV